MGGKTLPWYFLGVSNASGQFDISGTMWLVTIGFVYGLKSIWLPWLWPTFNQVFLAVYLSMWLRRSNVTTGAQWIETRFGKGVGSTLSHTIVVIFALIGALGFLAYGFVGLGKFVQIFIPWEAVEPYVGFHVAAQYVPHVYGIVFTLAAVLYTILGGMTSIVMADLLQYTIMTVSGIVVAVIAMTSLAHHPLNVPEGWMSPWFGWNLNMDWTGIIAEVNRKIAEDQFSLFSIIVMLMLFKGILASVAGPAPNYDMQKILATRSPREASLMSAFVNVVLYFPRYLLVAGFVVLGLLFYGQLNLTSAGRLDFEQVMPSVINEFVPAGWTGLLLAGLAAAFVGTFSGTLNAAQAYAVNDLYMKYINPKAPNSRIAMVNYGTGVVIVILSIVLGVFAQNVNSLLQWIVSALYGSYVASNMLKWYWWRFNAHGYFWGMVTGLVPALVVPLLWPDVRPWGAWGPIRKLVEAEDPKFERNRDFKRDMVNVFVGMIWQTAVVVLPFYLVLMRWTGVAVAVAILAVASVFLKRNWYDRLPAQ